MVPSSPPTTSATATPTNTTADESAAIEVKKRDAMDAVNSELKKVEDQIESTKQDIESTKQEIKSITQEIKSNKQAIELNKQAIQDAQAKADMESPPVHPRDHWMEIIKQLQLEKNYLCEKENILLAQKTSLLAQKTSLLDKEKRHDEKIDKLSDEVKQLHIEKKQRVDNMQQHHAKKRDDARERAQTFLKAIMSELEDIPNSNGMRVMRMVPNLERGVKGDIVIRTITEPFWQECIDTVCREDNKFRVCAVGSPGIGKSTSTPFLIRMVLKKGHTVVYHIQTDKNTRWFYEFKPINKQLYKVEVYPETLNESSILSLDDPNTFYIVDPGKTKTTCDQPDDFLPKVIIIASPDDCYWGGNEFAKERSGMSGTFRYYPIWEYDELLAAKSKLNNALSKEDILLRYNSFGGIPRTIFGSDDHAKLALTVQDNAIHALGVEKAKLLATNQLDVVSSFKRTQPKSAIIGYTRDENDNRFFDAKVVIVSRLVAEKLARKYMRALWNDMISLGDNGWWMFEAYTRELMMQIKFQLTCRKCCGKMDRRYDKHEMRSFGGCTEMRVVDDITGAPLTETKIVFHSIRRKFKPIDFVYTDEDTVHAFQVTIGHTHSANEDHIKELVKKIPKGKTLLLYYLVPEQQFENFVNSPVDPSVKGCSIFHVLIPDPNNESKPKPMDTSTN